MFRVSSSRLAALALGIVCAAKSAAAQSPIQHPMPDKELGHLVPAAECTTTITVGILPIPIPTPTPSPPLGPWPKQGDYSYMGCFNDTNPDDPALETAATVTVKGHMTAPGCIDACLAAADFTGRDDAGEGARGTGKYWYAGLEWDGKNNLTLCMCSDNLSPVAEQRDDSECNRTCDGNQTWTCGGIDRITLYTLSDGGHRGGGHMVDAGAVSGVSFGALLVSGLVTFGLF
ncbi:hypothetical protein DL766_002805 [Monosporascus sp. MC13-8B]|uniref:WSC domain-containing protein n=1 Tax=Monosporascus cannonballus TaxID=155416 RepID=A0ABY0H4B0_9PEZI|nr:hypothetical protein DL762_007149 [Monosporascus cannonballus]RYO88170.1 hypothetical protein DL763_006075 [Monosporascus cannonballus]RYP34815.1 hypothetical protein DL766_002805 [Monosporascus sp. MC13-8B]